MVLNNKFNGERLKMARLYRGMTLEELAHEIGIKKQSISLYETGKTTPEVENLFKLIKTLRFPKEYFFQPSLCINTGTAYFRALLTTNNKYRVQQVYKNKFLGKIYEFLSKYMDFPSLNLPDDIDLNNDIETITQSLRHYWKLGNEPIKNIVNLLEKNGILVALTETDSNNIDAFNQSLIINNEEKFIVVLSKNKSSAARTQFDGAHELGHIILHPRSEDIESLSREEFKKTEKEAHEFAASFLLPKEAFMQDLPEKYRYNLDYYINLKKKWNVSISAMIMRAHHLNLIPFSKYQYLMRKISQRGWRTGEPLDDTIKMPEPTLLKYAIDLLLDNNIFNKKTIVEEISKNGLALEIEDIGNLLGLEKGKLLTLNNEISMIQPRLKN